MEKQCISAPNGPPAQGPYSPAVAVPLGPGAGRLLFVSGMVPAAPDGSGIRRGTLEEQARLALSNLKAVLEDSGSSLSQVVKVNVYLASMDDFSAFNVVYGEFFTGDFPARTCIEAGRLPFDIRVEIEAVALAPGTG